MAVFHRNISLSFLLAAVCSIASFVFGLIAYATPYWVVSWPRLFSKFRRIGLWNVCLNGYVHPHDPSMTAYVGCWWILSTEFLEVRFWLLPAWFVFCQIIMTLSMLLNFLVVVLSIAMLIFRIQSKTGSFHRGLHGRFGPTLLKLASAFGFTSLIFVVTTCILVWVYSMDPYWLPQPEINKMSWSYGFALLSAFGSGFGSISYIYVHRGLFGVGRNYHEAPPSLPDPPRTEKM